MTARMWLELEPEGDQPARRVEVGPEGLSIGRDAGNGLVLEDKKASRRHAEIRFDGTRWMVVDLGSANRTRVGDLAVDEHPLTDGDTVVIGTTTLRVRLEEEPRVVGDALAPSLAAPSPPAAIPTPRRTRGGRFLIGMMIGLGAGTALGVWIERTTPPERPAPSTTAQPHADRPVPPTLPDSDREADPIPTPPPPTMPDAAHRALAERLLESLRRLQEAGQLGGAYAVRDVLAASAAEAPDPALTAEIDRISSTLDALARETLDAAITAAEAARQTSGSERARAILSACEGRLAGTPLAAAIADEIARLDRAMADQATRTATTAPDEREPDAPTEAPTWLGRVEIDRLRDHVAQELLAHRLDAALEVARWTEARLPPTGAEELRRLLVGTEWEPRLRAALESAIATRAERGDPLTIALGGETAEVVGIDAGGLTLRLRETGTATKPWHAVSAPEYLGMVDQLDDELGFDRVQIAGAYARRGMTAEAGEFLARLHEERGFAPAVAAYVAAAQGLAQPPEGGYVVFRGELIPAIERDEILAAEAQAEARHRAEMARLEATSPENLPGTLVDYALRLFEMGAFERGHKVLGAVTQRFPQHERVRAAAAKAAANAVLSSAIVHSVPAVPPGEDPPPNRLDIVIAGDGYILDDRRQASFAKVADRVVEGFLDHEPFREYASYLTFRRVHCISKDHRISTEYETYESLFEGRRPRFGGQVEINWGKARGVLDAAFGDAWDTALVMVRQGSLGKGLLGGDLCAFQEGAVAIAFHEFGHSFGGLLDEYSTDPYGGRPLEGPIPTGPNLVTSTDLATCPWRHWIEAEEPGVGFVQGGAGRATGCWHPTARGCVMETGSEFCVVCREQIMLRLYRLVRPVERALPETEAVIDLERGRDTEVVFTLALMKPATHALDVAWTINGTMPIAGRSVPYRDPASGEWRVEGRFPYSAFRESSLESGATDNEVTATIHDPTPWVLADPEQLLTQVVTWRVRAHKPEAEVTPEAEPR